MGIRVDKIILRQVRMPLVHFFETSFGRTTERQIVLVEATAGGVSGWGEVTAGENPFYNEEWTDSAWLILRNYAGPRVLKRELGERLRCRAAARPHPRPPHGVRRPGSGGVGPRSPAARAAAVAHIGGGARKEIACGVSIGIQESVPKLLKKIEGELAAGYQRIKMKIKPGWDIDVVREVRREFPQIRLMVDANSAYQLADADHLRRLDEFYLMMIEQPLSHDDIIDHAQLQAKLDTPICLDECIRSAHHAEQAIRMRAAKIINIKLGRVGGFAEARRVHDVAQAAGVPVWCGGMLESGIGRAHNVALSTLPNFILPGDVSASKRYWARDVIVPPVEVTPQAAPSWRRTARASGTRSTWITCAASPFARRRWVDARSCGGRPRVCGIACGRPAARRAALRIAFRDGVFLVAELHRRESCAPALSSAPARRLADGAGGRHDSAGVRVGGAARSGREPVDARGPARTAHAGVLGRRSEPAFLRDRPEPYERGARGDPDRFDPAAGACHIRRDANGADHAAQGHGHGDCAGGRGGDHRRRRPKGGMTSLWATCSSSSGRWRFALFTIGGKRSSGRHGGITVSTFAYVGGALMLAPLTLWQAWDFEWSAVSAAGWASILYMAAFPSVLCYLIYYWALTYIPASRVAALSYLQPLIATLLAVPLLGEPITLPLMAGGAMVFAGVYTDRAGLMSAFTRLLRQNRNYRYTWMGQVVSEIGDHFNNIAVFSLALAVTRLGPGGHGRHAGARASRRCWPDRWRASCSTAWTASAS